MEHTGNTSAKDLTIYQDQENKELARVMVEVGRELDEMARALGSIESWDDFEAVVLRDQGLAGSTYRSYMYGARRFYEFMAGLKLKKLNLLQVTAGHLEKYYDLAVKRSGIDAARWDMFALKKLFLGLEKKYPIYAVKFGTPFKKMSKETKKKILRSTAGNRTKEAIHRWEIKPVLEYLAEKKTPEGRRDYALVLMLVSSGLRSAELLQLRWKDIVRRPAKDGEFKYYALFIGKGGHTDEQELQDPAVTACREYFKAAIGRDPQAEDVLFHAEPFRKNRPLAYNTLLYRTQVIGEELKAAGLIRPEVVVSPHLFRRSAVTILYEGGMRIKAIQKFSRHRSVETLMRHYVNDTEMADGYLKDVIPAV